VVSNILSGSETIPYLSFVMLMVMQSIFCHFMLEHELMFMDQLRYQLR
jgi:hypothetical protein